MPARASPSGFAVPYNVSISLTYGFAFGAFSCDVYSTSDNFKNTFIRTGIEILKINLTKNNKGYYDMIFR